MSAAATPDGPALRRWLKAKNMTRRAAAKISGTSFRQFARYCLPPESKNCTPMPASKWLALKDFNG